MLSIFSVVFYSACQKFYISQYMFNIWSIYSAHSFGSSAIFCWASTVLLSALAACYSSNNLRWPLWGLIFGAVISFSVPSPAGCNYLNDTRLWFLPLQLSEIIMPGLSSIYLPVLRPGKCHQSERQSGPGLTSRISLFSGRIVLH